MDEFPDTPISEPEKKKRRRKMKSRTCDCWVEHDGPFEDLDLFTQNCEVHKTIFDVVTVLIKKEAQHLFNLQDAWRDYIWNHGEVLYYWEDDDE